MHSVFITFEGGEGSGKSTQARMLADRLGGLGHEVVLTREPGGSPLAERIRALLLEQKPQSSAAEFLLFAAARAEHIATLIAPARSRGAVVICDRFIDSTRVYQGRLGTIDTDLMSTVERHTVAPHFPNLTLVLDVPPETGLKRAAARGALNHYDRRELGWHVALREAFHEAAAAEPRRCVLIDGAREPAVVAADVWRCVASRLGLA